MKRIVLRTILLGGRYAVLPVVALAGVLLFVWLLALDRYTMSALVTAPVVFCVATAAIALALGILLLPSRTERNVRADEDAAPGLWAMWKELDPAFTRSGRTLLIDTNFNASIMEASQYTALFGRHVTMTVGLPMLIILDQRAIRAIIAHEVAHAQLRHTSGGANLVDFITASENVLHYADPDRTITGRIARALLNSLLQWLEQEHRALSRENELCADAGAANQVGRDEAARALVLVEAAAARLTDLVYKPLEKEMLGATRAPASPLQRMFNQRQEIRAPEQLAVAAAAALKHELDPESTHPPFSKRLANLGFTAIPPIDQVQTSAIDELLSRKAVAELPARFDDEWRKQVRDWVSVGR